MPLLQRPTLGDKHAPVGHFAGKAHVVRNDDQVSPLIAQLGDEVENLGGHFRIERRSRFVEDQKARFDGDGAHDGHALLLTAGKLRRTLVGMRGEMEAREQRIDNITRF